MRYLGTFGAEYGSNAGNKVIIDGGITGLIGPSGSVPVGSKSTQSQGFRGTTWHAPLGEGSDATGTPRSPSGARWGFQMQALLPTANTAIRFGMSDDATEVISLTKDPTTGRVALYIAGAEVAVSPTYVWGLGAFRKFTIDVLSQAAGHVKVYVDGDLSAPVIDHPLAGAIGVPNSCWAQGVNVAGIAIDDLIAWEWGVGLNPDLLEEVIDATVGFRPPVGPGPYTDWTDGSAGAGTYDLIDERPPNNADLIEATSVDEASTFDFEDSDSERVLFATARMKIERSGTDAGSSIQLRFSQGGTDLDLPAVPAAAPGDGYVTIPIDTAADGTRLELASDFNAATAGPVART